MDEKLKLKNDYDEQLGIGREVFDEAVQNKKIEKWVKIYLPFMDENMQKEITEYYENLYYKKDGCELNV
jgi:hypothetical protein